MQITKEWLQERIEQEQKIITNLKGQITKTLNGRIGPVLDPAVNKKIDSLEVGLTVASGVMLCLSQIQQRLEADSTHFPYCTEANKGAEAKINAIAKKQLRIEYPNCVNDYRTLNIWTVQDALREAYLEGQRSMRTPA